jgi:transcriptional regulator with XRE-family HTH domain
MIIFDNLTKLKFLLLQSYYLLIGLYMMTDYAPLIIRSIRKLFDLTHIEFSKVTGISKKDLLEIESGISSISPSQWIIFCQTYNIDSSAIINGRIEIFDTAKSKADHSKTPGSFQIDSKYKSLMSSTVQTIYPLIKFMEDTIGKVNTLEFFELIKTDRDYFVIQNLPISLSLAEEIFYYLSERGHIDNDNISVILAEIPIHELHRYSLCSNK